MKTGNKTGGLGRWFRAGMVFSMLMAGVVLLAGPGTTSEPDRAVATGWGTESLHSVQAGLQMISPIALANACGLGASSCFKCHNGKRAAAPGNDMAKSPWHVQHGKVNNSCVGCHKGNPRIMVKEMAHNSLLKSPRSGEVCADCHKADQAKVEAVYKAWNGEGK
ncbi:MAG: hypothetical protein PHR30_09755 [Gallionellaceae bacterium]|nr:hypothetical protein [Gallionellaceae bacterium]